MTKLETLMVTAGAADVAVAAWEREQGCKPSPEYNRLLQASADAKSALRCEMARLTGTWHWSLFAKQISPELNNTTTTDNNNMAKLNEAFPSKYLTAADLEDSGDVTATIQSADIETIGQGQDKSQKIIIKLKGLDKAFVCNRTNANTIAKVTGSDDTDDWIGKRITIGAREVEFKGDMMMAIRVSLRKPDAKQAAPAHEVGDGENF